MPASLINCRSVASSQSVPHSTTVRPLACADTWFSFASVVTIQVIAKAAVRITAATSAITRPVILRFRMVDLKIRRDVGQAQPIVMSYLSSYLTVVYESEQEIFLLIAAT